eukprot:scaffold4278_cov263-Pinguiococcus_pyrenoidosus.AAC.2
MAWRRSPRRQNPSRGHSSDPSESASARTHWIAAGLRSGSHRPRAWATCGARSCTWDTNCTSAWLRPLGFPHFSSARLRRRASQEQGRLPRPTASEPRSSWSGTRSGRSSSSSCLGAQQLVGPRTTSVRKAEDLKALSGRSGAHSRRMLQWMALRKREDPDRRATACRALAPFSPDVSFSSFVASDQILLSTRGAIELLLWKEASRAVCSRWKLHDERGSAAVQRGAHLGPGSRGADGGGRRRELAEGRAQRGRPAPQSGREDAQRPSRAGYTRWSMRSGCSSSFSGPTRTAGSPSLTTWSNSCTTKMKKVGVVHRCALQLCLDVKGSIARRRVGAPLGSGQLSCACSLCGGDDHHERSRADPGPLAELPTPLGGEDVGAAVQIPSDRALQGADAVAFFDEGHGL